MTSRPPYPHIILRKRSEAVTTAGGAQAYTHLLLELWSFIPTVFCIALLLAAAVWCVLSGALGFQAGWLAVVTFILLAAIPIVLNVSEVSPWFSTKSALR